MATSLVIVESPAKARTINKILGKGYSVKASMGHVRDLPKKNLGVAEDRDFEPTYELIAARAKVLAEIRKAAQGAEHIYIATDPDREGEAIGWHLAQILDPDEERTQRVSFNEITRNAVLAAFESPTEINRSKVDAQQTRRIMDRLVGYKISPLLWDKVRRGLSAGRVQSVALRIVCDREREIQAFKPEEFWNLEAQLDAAEQPRFTAKLARREKAKIKVRNAEEANAIQAELADVAWKVASIERKKRRRSPLAPFITSKLQQDAARQLRFPVKKTMRVAQKLYEGVSLGDEGSVGLITYMRTDSTRVAGEAIQAVREFIAASFGKEALPAKPRSFASKKRAQDAHEAIRPTSMERTPERVRPYLSTDELRLYRLIWNRFVASQMNPAVYDQTTVEVEAGRYIFRTTGSVLVQKGYLAVYHESNGQEPEGQQTTLPPLSQGQELTLHQLDASQNFTEPPPRFMEASLVKELEENGIGRPSTYASILATLQNREYTMKEEGRFVPTELGFLITDLLSENFADILDVGYTARLERQFEAIEEGNRSWLDTLDDFNKKFSKDLDRAAREMRNVKREEIPTDETCEKCGSTLVKKWGRFGSFLACSAYPECKFTKEIGSTAVETPSGVEPCEKCGADMATRRGRFGPFLACTNYPTCKNTRRLVVDKEGQVREAKDTLLEETCPECGLKLARKHGRFGDYVGCSGYPKCRYIQHKDAGVDCPKEGCTGRLVERRSKRGKVFYGCSAYPDCDFVLWQKPVAEPCPECGAPFLVERQIRKTVKRSCHNKDCKYVAEVAPTSA